MTKPDLATETEAKDAAEAARARLAREVAEIRNKLDEEVVLRTNQERLRKKLEVDVESLTAQLDNEAKASRRAAADAKKVANETKLSTQYKVSSHDPPVKKCPVFCRSCEKLRPKIGVKNVGAIFFWAYFCAWPVFLTAVTTIPIAFSPPKIGTSIWPTFEIGLIFFPSPD